MITEMTFKKLSMIIFVALLAFLTIFILYPIIIPIFLGLILGYSFYPLYNFFFKYIKERNSAAIIVVIIFILIILLPLWFLFPLIVKQLFDAYLFLQGIDFHTIVISLFPNTTQEAATSLATVLNTFIARIIGSASTGLSSFILDFADISFKFVVFLFVFFFTMRDSEKLSAYIKEFSPFNSHAEKKLITQFKGITNSVIYGQILIGIIQGTLTGIGLWIFGIPNVILYTFVAILFGIIPVIGTWLVWIPAMIYLFTLGETWSGVGLLLYGGIIVGWIDNLIRPKITAAYSNLSTPITLIGMVGGLLAFGILGLILGPLILSYLIILLESYQSKVSLFCFDKKENCP